MELAARHPWLRLIELWTEKVGGTLGDKRCHVGVFMQSFAGGGAERVMVSLANEIAGGNAKVDLIVVDMRGPLASEVSGEVRIVHLARKSAIRSVPALARYIKRERPSVVMSTVDNINFSLVLSVILFRLKVRTVVRLANAPSSFGVGGKGVKARLFRRLRTRILRINRRADMVVAVSKGVAQEFREISGVREGRICVIYNPVLALPLHELAERPVENQKLFHDRIPVIIAVGRLEPQKDFGTLIRAFALVLASRSAKLCILGEGSERGALERLARELGIESEIVMPGFDRNPFKYVSRSNVFVLSSLYEGLPNALIQALALKVPVVSTDCKHGPREILDNGKWGLLVKPGDAVEMASAIELQLDNPMPPIPDDELECYGPHVVVRKYRDLLC